jgi:hypothetical protein
MRRGIYSPAVDATYVVRSRSVRVSAYVPLATKMVALLVIVVVHPDLI